MRYLFLLIALAISGCVAVPIGDISRLDDMKLCAAYGEASQNSFHKGDMGRIREAIDQRNLLTQDEWSMVERGQVKVGMSECGLKAIMGPEYRENVMQGSYGRHVQHVYTCSMCGGVPTMYVYTENGKITSWQH